MIVNNFMRDLNANMTKMDKLQGQLASGRKFAHISDDPIALIYAQAARNRIARLSHYQDTVATAQDWIRQVESGVMELQGRVTDVYEEIINAATDVKGGTDKNNIAMLISQLKDHYVDTLNATFGDKYMYAGYNTPGDSKTGQVTGPFTIDSSWNLYYNGQSLSNFTQISIGGVDVNPNDAKGIFGGLNIDMSGDVSSATANLNNAISNVNALTPQIDTLNADIKSKAEELSPITTNIDTLTNEIENLNNQISSLHESADMDTLTATRDAKAAELADQKLEEGKVQQELDDLRQQRTGKLQELGKYINTDPPQYDASGRVSLTVGGVPLLKTDDPGNNTFTVTLTDQVNGITDFQNKAALVKTLQGDVLTFDVGPSVSMPVTINGIDLVLFQAPNGNTLNIFSILQEAYNAASSDAPADELGLSISALQNAQNHLLTKVAELGGRTRRLDLLSARYDQDSINYQQMKSDAEDADFAEVIMNQKMAEAVYQAALSAGARIIQPTLMDFLK